MTTLELKIPPPIVAFFFGLLMWFASWLGGTVSVPFAYRTAAAIAIALVGAVFGVSAMTTFVRAKTTMNPTKPDTTSSLVTHGVYRFTRNPMYLSLALYLVAWAAYLANWLALLVVPLFMLYLYWFQIQPEERALTARFGAEFAAYKERVRRWI